MKPAKLFTSFIAFVLTIGSGASAGPAERDDQSERADKYEMVVCLLPSVVRKLGGRFNYARPQKPVEITAGDCEIRGGEYTAYDRSNYETALAIWKAAAETGDAEAQTKVGEIYEKYLDDPDYEAAAAWYTKASENGNTRAMRNLAYLYEHGLGVEPDLQRSLALWRQGMGIGEELVLASEMAAVKSEAERKVAAMTARLGEENAKSLRLQQQLQSNVDSLREQMLAAQKSGRELESLRAALDEARAAGAAGDDSRVSELESTLARRQNTIEEAQSTIALLQNEISAQRAQIEASTGSADIHQQRLQQALSSLAEERRQMGAVKQQLADTQQEFDARMREKDAETQALRAKLTRSNEELAAQQRGVEQLQADIVAARTATGGEADSRVASLQAALAAREEEIARTKATLADLRGAWSNAHSEIAALELELAESEDTQAVLQASLAQKEKEIIQQKAALGAENAALDQLNLDKQAMQQERDALAARLSESEARFEQGWEKWRSRHEELNRDLLAKNEEISDLSMRIIELEINGDRLGGERLAFANAVTRSYEPPPEPLELTADMGLDKYQYRALVIGNWDYADIQDLPTVKNDVYNVKEVLEKRYGFDVNLQVNLTRQAMLRELKELQEYGENNLVLIYYAGHGYLDEFQKGYWLPVDFEESNDPWSTAVPVDQITQHVNQLTAKHVMLVVDSCYSGTLGQGSSVELRDVEKKVPFWLSLASRTVLTSNDLTRELDAGPTGLSIFAEAFTNVLAENLLLMPGETLAARVAALVRQESQGLAYPQDPQFAGLREAGHANGQFVFYPHAAGG
jgi:predicted  nucleic acid-binding Zn-ribbon protein